MKKLLFFLPALLFLFSAVAQTPEAARRRISLNDGWRFYLYDAATTPDDLIYDVRPEVQDTRDDKAADSKPTEAIQVERKQQVLKGWILPTGNAFIKDQSKRYARPEGNPGENFPFVQKDFDDRSWKSVDLPHDWAIAGPFFDGAQAKVGGGMGRLPSPGVAWYRKKITIPKADVGKSIFLDFDGAMSYAMVWLNGSLAGGWPYGYASFRVDLTPYLHEGINQIAIRIDNPPNSSRWYPGGGIYRNVWLTTTAPVHVANWGTFVTTREVSKEHATIDLAVVVDNHSSGNAAVSAVADLFLLDSRGNKSGSIITRMTLGETDIVMGGQANLSGSVTIKNPKPWGPPPTQYPNLYVLITTVYVDEKIADQYETRFGIRSLQFDPDKGVMVNGEKIFLKGANQHHDLGALGSAFNIRAAERQLEILREAGCNSIRMAHNPPAPELLDLTDRMGFLVIDEIFDAWERKKTPLDFHLIFPDWHEQDVRAFVRRDRNHPSVILWSFGNEVGEQYTEEKGAFVARNLCDMVSDEDPTRLSTVSMNYAKPHMPLPKEVSVLSLNYQGEGIRDAPAYAGLQGIRTSPLFPAFREQFPNKVIISSENAAAVSLRGEYLFPVSEGNSAPVKEGFGGNARDRVVSSYELYTVDFGASADKVFASEDKHPYVAGGFVWSGWDYMGEPTPYYSSRSSYFGIIDLAGFKKDRFYLYQSRWRPEFPMVHILPHWTWPDRIGQVTPVHVFTSGDEVELFLNGKSLGRKKKLPYEYRLRWDNVTYEPGELKAVSFRNGKKWAEEIVRTAGTSALLKVIPDRDRIKNDAEDLVFVTIRVADKNDLTVPNAKNKIHFSIEGPGEIVATDNGDPRSLVPFTSHDREAFNGLCLVIVRAKKGETGVITVKARADGLKEGTEVVRVAE